MISQRNSSPRHRHLGLVAAAVALLTMAGMFSGCSSDSETVTVADAWIALPTRPEATGAFGVLANNGTAAVTLSGVSVPSEFAAGAQLHEMVMVDGEMKMQEVVGGLVIEPGTELVLKSGSYHIMLMQPTLEVGRTVPLTLTFGNGESMTLNVTVREAVPPTTTTTTG